MHQTLVCVRHEAPPGNGRVWLGVAFATPSWNGVTEVLDRPVVAIARKQPVVAFNALECPHGESSDEKEDDEK